MRRLVVFVVAFVATVALLGCRPALSPRHLARGAVLSVAQAVRVGDHVCASKARAIYADGEGDVEAALALATKCAKGYDLARKSLIAAAYAVDAWGSAEASGKAVCAVSEATAGLRLIIAALRESGVVTLPGEVADGMAAAQWIADQVQGGQCEVGQ